MFTSRKMLVLATALVSALTLGACGVQASSLNNHQGTNLITVNASAEVHVVPDKASFTTEVLATASTAQDAQDQGTQAVDAVLALLEEKGVDEKNIQTSYANVSPIYDWSTNTERITGYEMRTSITVSDVAIEEVGGLMQACIGAGATGFSGPSYYASNYDEAYLQALNDAIAASRVKAEGIAKAAGVRLGQVVSVTEGYENTAYRAKSNDATTVMVEEAGSALDIAPGEVGIDAEVTVCYAIS